MIDISELVKKQKRHKISYMEIARYCNVHRTSVSRILSGETKRPNPDIIEKIEKAVTNLVTAKKNMKESSKPQNKPKKKEVNKMMLGDEVLNFFDLSRDPWEDGDVDQTEIWESVSFKNVTNQILEAMKRSAFLLVYGETGTGKSVLIQKILKKIKYWKRQIIVYVSPLFTEDFTMPYLASEIIEECGSTIPRDKRKRARKLIEVILKAKKQRQNVVLVLDEVHQLKGKIIKALKRLHEGLGVHQSKLGVIMIGQPEIVEDLQNSYLREVDKRLSYIRLDPLNALSNKGTSTENVKNYINHRLKLSGGSPSIFTDDAIKEIALRVETLQDINDLCSGLMYDVFLQNEDKVITREVVEEH